MSSVIGDEGICTRCVHAHGLCSRHALGILPQLKQPSWHRDAHSGFWTEKKERAAAKAQPRHAGRAQNKARRRGYLGLIDAIRNVSVVSA